MKEIMIHIVLVVILCSGFFSQVPVDGEQVVYHGTARHSASLLESPTPSTSPASTTTAVLPYNSNCVRSSCCNLKSKFFDEFRRHPLNFSVSTPVGTDRTWTFGYGSNMNPIKLAAWGITPIHSVPAVLGGYCFSTIQRPLPFVDPERKASLQNEPAFGNIIPDKKISALSSSNCVHGVAHLITRTDERKLDKSESTYRKKKVSVVSYSGEDLIATAYVAKASKYKAAPSTRYSRLVYCGASRIGLCPDYLRQLYRFLFEERLDQHDSEIETCKAPVVAMTPNALQKMPALADSHAYSDSLDT